MSDDRVLGIHGENKELNNIIKHVEQVTELKAKIFKRFERESSINPEILKTELTQRISSIKMYDDELLTQLMKLFFHYEMNNILKRNFEENLEGFLSTIIINKVDKD